MVKNIFAFFVVLMLTGCATSRGFDRGALSHELGKAATIDDASIEKILAIKPQLPSPFSIGVYFNDPVTYPSYYSNGKIYWSGKDKELLEKLGATLVEKGVITKFAPILASTTNGSDLKSLRLAAARYGVDAVLVINGVSALDKYNNKLSISYLLLLPAAFVNGNVVDSMFVSSATLWDVKNEYLYMAAEAEGLASDTFPALFTRNIDVAIKAKENSIEALVKQLESNISNLK